MRGQRVPLAVGPISSEAQCRWLSVALIVDQVPQAVPMVAAQAQRECWLLPLALGCTVGSKIVPWGVLFEPQQALIEQHRREPVLPHRRRTPSERRVACEGACA